MLNVLFTYNTDSSKGRHDSADLPELEKVSNCLPTVSNLFTQNKKCNDVVKKREFLSN
jgi:hypothetical protein